jgi:hypothetical protein
MLEAPTAFGGRLVTGSPITSPSDHVEVLDYHCWVATPAYLLLGAAL